MDIGGILDNTYKYHYVGCGKKKCKLLASSDNKTEAKKKTIAILKPYESEIVDSIIYLVTVKKSVSKWTKSKNKLIPGPIMITITEYKVSENVGLTIMDSGINNQIFVTEKYLEENDEIDTNDILDLVYKFDKKKLKKGLMEKNTL